MAAARVCRLPPGCRAAPAPRPPPHCARCNVQSLLVHAWRCLISWCALPPHARIRVHRRQVPTSALPAAPSFASRRPQLSKDQAESFYAEHTGKPFFAGLIDFMTSGPVVALALAGVGAIKAWRDMMGPTNTARARAEAPRSLRALYGTDGTRNATHGSDSEASASREIKFFFPSLQPETAPDAAAFIEAQLQQVLTVGLTALSKSKPGTPAAGVRQLAHWLLENNPNAARRVEPGAPAELGGGEVDGVDEMIARAERKSAAAKVKSEHNLARRSTQAVLDIQEKSIVQAKAALAHVESTHDVGAAERGFAEELRARQRTADAFKAAAAVDWLPEYHPASIVPPGESKDTIVERVTRVSLASILTSVPCGRKTKIVATLGPSCWSEEGLASLLDAGLNVARFNFSHGSHEAHQEVLDRLRKVAAAKSNLVAFLLDTKGPEIRTAMLRGGKDIHLTKGQELTIVAAGDEYTTWEGFKDEATGETKIGISYAKLCQSVKPGNVILIADGAISIEVLQVLSERELRGRVINSYKLGQRKNCNLPGVHVDLPVLAAKDIDDVQNFACKNDMDFIAASFVQSVEDVRCAALCAFGEMGRRLSECAVLCTMPLATCGPLTPASASAALFPSLSPPPAQYDPPRADRGRQARHPHHLQDRERGGAAQH